MLSLPWLLLTVPFSGAWFLLIVTLAALDWRRKPQISVTKPKWGLYSAAIMFAALGLLWMRMPMRAVFLVDRAGFRSLVAAAPLTKGHHGIEMGKRIGPYWVDRYGADERGGVYFRTHAGPDGLGPDTMSYGFAYRPNYDGTPFGDAQYHRRRLFGDWYVFRASDDW